MQCASHSNHSQGGHAVQLQKTFEAIMHKEMKKKTALTNIQEGMSDNPMGAPLKTNCKAKMVATYFFICWYLA